MAKQVQVLASMRPTLRRSAFPSSIRRWVVCVLGLATALLACFAASAAAAGPETFYVRAGGAGAACTEASPCATVQEAIEAHRVAASPGDVIDVGPGVFEGNVGADQLEDDGLTIRGTLNGGTRQTTLRGTDFGFDDSDIAVLLGACAESEVILRDLAVDTEGADSFVQAIALDGGSDLTNVRARTRPRLPPTPGPLSRPVSGARRSTGLKSSPPTTISACFPLTG